MKKQWIFGAILLLAVTVLVIMQVAKEKEAEDTEQEVIKIGAILPLTGAASVYGANAKSGMEKALKSLGEDMLLKNRIKIYFEDSKTDPKEAITAYQRLRMQNINIIITTLSPICLAIKPIAIKDNVLFFGNASHPEIVDSTAKNVFRHSSTLSQEADFLVSILKKNKIQKVSIVSVNDEYGKAFSTLFVEELKNQTPFKIESVDLYDPKVFDVNTLALKIKKIDPDIVVLNSFGSSAGALIKKIREQKIDAEIFSTIGFSITNVREIAGEASMGVRFVDFDFITNNDISASECLEYGTIKLIANVLANTNGEPKEMIKKIESMKYLDIDTEYMTFLPSREIIPKIKIDTVK